MKALYRYQIIAVIGTKVLCDSRLLQEDSEVVISDLRDRNYTIIKSTDTLKPLYNYTADKFLNYIEDVFLAITTNINEDEKAILLKEEKYIYRLKKYTESQYNKKASNFSLMLLFVLIREIRI